ncbi:MAG: transcription antitermination factor NusB [Candidatus Izemoplasmatales bacterium]
MNRKEFREEMMKIIYAYIMNPEQDFSAYDENILNTFKDFLVFVEDIDHMIEKHLVNWSLQRLNYVDLAIIRYAVYELVYLEQAKEIVMNEALELTKKYSNLDDDLARKFNNRLLQNIVDGLSDQDG